MRIEQRILEQSWDQAAGEGEYDEARRIAALAQNPDVAVMLDNLMTELNEIRLALDADLNDANAASGMMGYISLLVDEINELSEVPPGVLSRYEDIMASLEDVFGSGIRSSPLPDASDPHA